jgi:SAM-dependent methyltransferase
MMRAADAVANVAAACPICAGRRLHPVLRKNGWTVYRCAACTNGFLAGMRPGEGSFEHLDWFQREPEPRGIVRRCWRAVAKAWKRLVYGREFEARKLRRVLRWRDGGRLLDVGCARGEFLHVARHHFEVQGVEVSPTALTEARATLGHQVFAGDLLEANLPAAFFDVITLFSTVEHLAEPVAVLQECRRLLRDGGILVIKTPNFSSLNRRLLRGGWSGYKLPEHRFFFTPSGIRRLFGRVGLEPLPAPWLDRHPLSDNMFAYARKERDGERGA